jgi:hypothetical protein
MLGMTVQQWIKLYPLSLLLLVPMYVAALMWVLSWLSGWSQLTRRFSAKDPFRGETWRWQSARFRGWCSYNNCLTVGASQEGLYLAVMPILIPFRLFHPPLMIPWREIDVETGKAVFGFYDTAQFRIGVEERVTLKIYGKLVNIVREAAGPGWPLHTLEQISVQTKL